MKKTIKAALLSGLVFPGFGQLTLKRYKRGILIILLVCIAVLIIAGMATHTAYEILKKELQYGIVDFSRLLDLAHHYSKGKNPYYYACITLIICCWAYSIIDALIFGDRKTDKTEASSPPDSHV
jgi:hypothetical protein